MLGVIVDNINKMVDCGGFGSIDILVKVFGFLDVVFCLVIVLFLGNFDYIVCGE